MAWSKTWATENRDLTADLARLRADRAMVAAYLNYAMAGLIGLGFVAIMFRSPDSDGIVTMWGLLAFWMAAGVQSQVRAYYWRATHDRLAAQAAI